MSRRDPEDVVCDLAEEVHGRGAAVSHDDTDSGRVSRVWSAKGDVVREVAGPTKTSSRDALIRELRAALRVT